MINIRELARLANVSPGAASLALRGKPGVSEATRNRVLEVAAECGYRPNPMVSALMTQVGRRLRRRLRSIIGVLSSFDIERSSLHSTPGLLFSGLRSAATEHGYSLEQFVVRANAKPQPLARMLRTRNIRGLIIHLPEHEFASLDLDYEKFAFVGIGYPLVHHSVDFVCNNHGHSVTLAMENLRRLGYKRVGLALDESQPEHADSAMLSAYLGFQFETGRRAPRPLSPPSWGPDVFLAWYRREKPDAIICTDHLAITWLREAGLRVPEDIAFAHVDIDSRWTDIAGVDQCNHEVGAATMDLLVARLNANRYGFPTHNRTLMIHGVWVDGASTPPRKS